jgi:hypothetical protein
MTSRLLEALRRHLRGPFTRPTYANPNLIIWACEDHVISNRALTNALNADWAVLLDQTRTTRAVAWDDKGLVYYRAAYPTTCRTCGTTETRVTNEACYTCRFWTHELATPGGVIIGGWHHRIGAEPDPEVHASNPSYYGNYGRRYVIRILTTGEQVITHNLWDQGPIPAGFTRPDNAAFVWNDNLPEWGQP